MQVLPTVYCPTNYKSYLYCLGMEGQVPPGAMLVDGRWWGRGKQHCWWQAVLALPPAPVSVAFQNGMFVKAGAVVGAAQGQEFVALALG